MRNFFLGLFFVLASCAGPTLAPAQHLHGNEAVSEIEGKFFDRWMRPVAVLEGQERRTSSCCSKNDCGVRDVRFKDGKATFYHPFLKTWVLVPDNLLEQNQVDPEESPTGQSYVCHSKVSDTVYCAVLGSLQ